jgi:hypothetical protein
LRERLSRSTRRRRRKPQASRLTSSTSTQQGLRSKGGGLFLLHFGLAVGQFGTFGICDDCHCKVTEIAMSQHLTRARLSRSVFGALLTMIAFTAALFSAAHHFAG